MEKYHDMFRFVLELSDSKAISTAYFVLVATCVTAHTHRLRIISQNRARSGTTDKTPELPSITDIKNSNGGLPVSVIKIYYLDGCHISLDVTTDMTMKDICSKLSLEVKLGLYEVDQDIGPLTEQMLLPSSMTVEELINRWELYRWPDAKLVAPVYLKNWAYKQNSRALRHVRFENSYLTRSIEYSPYSPASETASGGQITVHKRNRSPNSTRPYTPLESTFTAASPAVSASTRARERTHALLNSLFTQHTDADPRQLSASVTEMSWERSLRRSQGTRDSGRRASYSPISPISTSSVHNSAPRTPMSMPNSAMATPERADDRPTERISAERTLSASTTPPAGTIINSPATSAVSPPQPERTPIAAAQSPETAAEQSQSNNTSSPPTSTGTRENTPDKIRPRTTVVHLHSDAPRSRSPSPNTTSPVPMPAHLNLDRHSPNSPAVADIYPTQIMRDLSPAQGQIVRDLSAAREDSPVTTNSSVSSYSLHGSLNGGFTSGGLSGALSAGMSGMGEIHGVHSPAASSSNARPSVSPGANGANTSGSTRYTVSAEDLATHTAHARNNALLNKLFGSFPVDNLDRRQATPERAAASAVLAGADAEVNVDPVLTSNVIRENEETQMDDASPSANRTMHSPHSSGTLTLSRSTSPGAMSVVSAAGSAAGSISPGGTQRRTRRTPRAAPVRPPFDTSYSSSFTVPSVSMLLALGEGAPTAAPRIILEKRLTPKKDDSTDSKTRPFPHTLKGRSAANTEGGEFSTPMKDTANADLDEGTVTASDSAAKSDVKVRLFTRRGSTGSIRVAASGDTSANASVDGPGSSAAPRSGRRGSVAQSGTPASTARITTTPIRSQLPTQSPKPLRRINSPSPYANNVRGRSGNPHSGASNGNALQMDVRYHTVHDVAFGRGTSAEPRRPTADDASVRSSSRGRSTSPHSTLSGHSGSHSRQGSARRGSKRASTNWIP